MRQLQIIPSWILSIMLKTRVIRTILASGICLLTSVAIAQYDDVTIDAGILHAHAQPSLLGGGAAFFDYDGDGWLDICMTGGRNPDRLYQNQGDMQFVDRSDLLPHNARKSATTASVTTGDINNDGCVDIILTTFSREDPTIFLKNNCDGTFTDVTQSANTAIGPGTGATLFDYDRDGLLDLYVINFVDTLVFIRDNNGDVIGFDHVCYPNQFYRNMGNFKFKDVTDDYQIGGNGCALAVAVLPLEDRKWGVYIANDFGEFLVPNQLFVYDDSSDSFEEKSEEYGLDVAVYGMGIGIGDYDNDMDFDVYVTNMGQNAFLENDEGIYVDKALEYGLDDTYVNPPEFSTGWGTFFFDSDNDRDLDLFVANGYVAAAQFLSPALVNPCKLFVNTGDGFFDWTESANVGINTINRGCIYGDIDNDGDLDIVVTNTIFGGSYDHVASYRLLENNGTSNHFLKIKLEGVESNRDAYGAQLVTYIDGEAYLQYLFSSGTHASQSSSIVHFGLGDAAKVDSLKIFWPAGSITAHYDLPANQMVRIIEGSVDFDIVGCLDPEDPNYNPNATIDGGCSVGTSASRNLMSDANLVDIYPTITNGQIFVASQGDIGDCRLQVVDGSGRVIDSRDLHLISGAIQEIDVSAENAGIYFIYLTSSNLHYTAKVVVAH